MNKFFGVRSNCHSHEYTLLSSIDRLDKHIWEDYIHCDMEHIEWLVSRKRKLSKHREIRGFSEEERSFLIRLCLTHPFHDLFSSLDFNCFDQLVLSMSQTLLIQLRKDLFFYFISSLFLVLDVVVSFFSLSQGRHHLHPSRKNKRKPFPEIIKEFFFSLSRLITSILLCFILPYNQTNRNKKGIDDFSCVYTLKYANINHIYSRNFAITPRQFSMKEISFVRRCKMSLITCSFSIEF